MLAALTITKERSEVVDFTYPYWEEPLAIVVRVWDHKESYFIKPLTAQVIIRIILWGLDIPFQ